MKYFIVGLHSSGKSEILDSLEKLGVKCGRLFSNLDSPRDSIYGSFDFELYSTKDVNGVFENNAYLFMQERKEGEDRFYEGLSKHCFDNNDVFVLSPDQVLRMSFTGINEPVCFIWIDNTRTNRYSRFKEEHRVYNFKEREEMETADMSSFVKTIYSKPILYFSNEDTNRISTIIYTLIKHPDLFEIYNETYNN